MSRPMSNRELALDYAFRIHPQTKEFLPVDDMPLMLQNAETFLMFLEGDEVIDAHTTV